VKRQAKQHIMNATREAIDPRLSGIEAQTAELQREVLDLAAELKAMRRRVESHLPRPDGRPEHLARYNLADVLAWRAAQTSAEFIEEHMSDAVAMPSRADHLRHAVGHAPGTGVILECGVGSGESLTWLEDLTGSRRVVGFDSFEGLPEDWRPGFDAGAFAQRERGRFRRAELCVGLFEDTLPAFIAALDEPIALLHVDCDLYSSTRTVLSHCMPRLAPNAVVVFDEFFNYPGWQQHEAKAWFDWLDDTATDVTYLSFVPSWEQVAVVVRGA